MGQIIAGVLVVAIILFLLFWLFGRRGPKPNSREVAMGVWSAFGPYKSVEDAERSLVRSTRSVFGVSSLDEHAAWIKGHVDNCRLWEKSGTLEQNIEFMQRGLVAFMVGPEFEAACARFKEESKTEALRLLEQITTDPGMENVAPALRAMINGSMNFQVHEEFEASQKERAERIVRGIGENVFNDPSDKAARMRKFLQELSRERTGEEVSTPEAMGSLYLSCITYAGNNPDSEFAKTFHRLDDEWKASSPQEAT